MRTVKILCVAFSLAITGRAAAQETTIAIHWDKTLRVSNTTPTLQVVYNPMLRENSPIFKGTFGALKDLGASYVRYVPWFPYPRAAVAELKAPTSSQTFWDFSYADPAMAAVMQAQEGRSVVINFSTTPAWMWKTEKPVAVDSDPDLVNWNYNQGRELVDTTGRQVADYYARLIGWYTQGGFTDELGKLHSSGHHYTIDYWEVLNEPDLEHNITPQAYTRLYDAIVTAMHKVSPSTKFTGISVAYEHNPEWFEYFLNPANHRPGIPLDAISYHFYGRPTIINLPISNYQYSFFDQANAFLDRVRYIEAIRKRLSPATMTQINEIGNILLDQDYKGVIPPTYWNLAGAMYAYLYLELTKIGVDVVGESQLVGYPTQFPDVSMMNWKSAKPNARYWVLKLLHDNLGPGDELKGGSGGSESIVAQAFATKKGRRLLLINKYDRDEAIKLPDGAQWISYVDESTGDGPAATRPVAGGRITLKPYTVAIVEFN
ncbi:glycosyl hydrolase family 39 [Puia sp. P3]|uniref:glycosyl hydrolase family 39 n=1 Tax=Puia sp. P3 TaxID=3423952 RepID=UPI003D665C2D